MQFFLIFLFAWLIQCGDAVIHRSEFKLNTSIYDGGNVIYRPHSNGMSYDLLDYPDELCNWILSTMPKNLTQREETAEKICKAVALKDAVNHTKEWEITMQLVTSTSDGQLINYSCPTFGELLKHMLTTLVAHFSQHKLHFNVHNYLPQGIPFDPKKARNVEINVGGYMCNTEFQPIPVTESNKYNTTFMKNVIKNLDLVNLGYALLTATQVVISDVSKFNGIDKIYVKFKLTYPQTYIMNLQINPDCDLANLLQMVITNVKAKAPFFLCGVTAEVVPPPTPPTVKPTPTKTTTATETTALASTTKRPMEMLVCAFLLSHLLANI